MRHPFEEGAALEFEDVDAEVVEAEIGVAAVELLVGVEADARAERALGVGDVPALAVCLDDASGSAPDVQGVASGGGAGRAAL